MCRSEYPHSHALMANTGTFLATVLPPDDALCLKPKDPATMSVKELKQAIRNAGLGSQAVGFSEKAEFVKLLQDHYASK